ncbi:serine/threonine-protein kinase [Umezawaea sp. Da 62-37]|uniref:serine/threonine-protein kinase n=1 Tax=Umezawaea sp. Da 62-37 TaxID=3075927 RepID=UPI0028F6E34B|nr:serine/threonine-protein kinase [Umezawaea sp. Da 62-37]WNV85101.1 serine/threonine-protein kinase [Umezawaea sp. Da 62-37]
MSGDELVAQRYRLERRVGTGGMGEVWLATDEDLGRKVALKRSHADDDGGQMRHEARIGAGLQHPNVISVYDTVLHHGTKWLVMEYLPARSLREIIRDDGPLPPKTVAVVGANISAALAAMHERRMIHRDVTPANVLVTDDGTAKLTDFGISHWAELTRTEGGQIVGTPAYMAPEVARGEQARSASDVFCLGATLFAAVEGRSPWGHPGPDPDGQLRRARAAELETAVQAGPLAPVLGALLALDPSARPSAPEAKRMLDAVSGVVVPFVSLSGSVPTTPAPTGTTVEDPAPTGPWRRKRGVLIGAAALVTVLAAAAVVHLNRDSNANAGTGQGAVLDARTADPCSLLDRSSLSKFGTGAVQFDSEYGSFNRCGLTVRLSQADSDIAYAGLLIERIPSYEAPSHPLGILGPIETPAERPDGSCHRPIPLPDGNRVRIEAYNQGARLVEPCEVAEAVAGPVLDKLRGGPIPRRAAKFADWSMANVDACATLGDADLGLVFGADVPKAEQELGNWMCSWDKGPLEVTVVFTREWRDDGDDGDQPVRIRSRTAAVHTTNNGCAIRIRGREYEKPTDITNEWVERADVELSSNDPTTTPQSLCDQAKVLAVAAETRLPEV